MIKILLNIPYKSVETQIEHKIANIKSDKFVIETTHIYGTNHETIQTYDPDIIISRGMTYNNILQSYPDKHIVEISMTSYDVIAAINNAIEKHNPKKIALCIQDIVSVNVEPLIELTGLDIEVFQVRNEEDVERAIARGFHRGIEVFVGGLTICLECDRLGIANEHIKNSWSAINVAITQAIKTAKTISQERDKAALFQSVLNNAPDATIAIDNDGKITALNHNAKNLFRVSPLTDPVGDSIDEHLPHTDWKQTITAGQPNEKLISKFSILQYVRCTPIIDHEIVVGALITILGAEKIQQAETQIRQKLRIKGLVAKYTFNDIVGSSQALLDTIKTAHHYAQVDANVLILGETGTGKELFAHSIHQESQRKDGPFVAVNCAALPENLLESELFGYEEGAFSGAAKGGKTGLFELANEGTIFLDEIGEIPLALQSKLLRVLQEGQVRRVGGEKIYNIDVRVISATNIDFENKIKDGKFRMDLYFRLNVLDLEIAPLRQRRSDIPMLINHFLHIFGKEYRVTPPILSKKTQELLIQRSWSGNVRELRNFCEKLTILHDGGVVSLEDLNALGMGEILQHSSNYPEILSPELSQKELANILEIRSLTNEQLAEKLGISRTTLWRWEKTINSK